MRFDPENKTVLLAVRLIICAAAVSFIIIGVQRGEAAIVLKKAVNICLECIGLG